MRPNADRDAEIYRQRLAGVAVRVLAAQYGVSGTRIRQVERMEYRRERGRLRVQAAAR
jgi:Mor family transcriptional regulator